ncbi:DNA polymerase Y family protein [Variovorax sp. J22P168]|uniref:DNA polymerase Y family protein n=1 Tax=Variovorax jilinensis TaxID=3053513 RepID=UPI0025772945|nr:DNA polymerase Y family protein [Variovorax sp. J22P168]MDM0011948.1 DNA polymerase Y family protein [Variovorax sp. J22P168]
MPSEESLGWWALQFSPRVARVDEALLLEVSACERLWGGRLALMRQLAHLNPAPLWRLQQAHGATSLIALARLRMFARGERPPADLPAGLPLDTLSAARAHLDVLANLGCRHWGQVAALPRGGFTRRFGKELRAALDVAYGLRPESHRWLTLPEAFEQKIELPALAEGAPELMWSANRLLAALQIWLRARQRGAVALELQWTLDLRRYNGVDLPPHQQITVRTAEPTQDMAHLRRLMAERLALTTLAAPASWLRLRSLETAPCAGASTSFLPEDTRKGDRLHELVERLSARLGRQQVLVPTAQADHRPERMQAWRPALQRAEAARTATAPDPGRRAGQARAAEEGDVIYPAWLLPAPVRLEMDGEHPCWRGPLRRLSGPRKVEAGWWGGVEDGGRPALREYFIAESPEAGLVWIFRERSAACFAAGEVRWYLQGLYA